MMELFIGKNTRAGPLCVGIPLRWRHNDHDGGSNHQPHGCLLNRLFRRKSKRTSKLRVSGLCVGNSPGPVNSPHKGPVTRKMFPFDDVIMHLDIVNMFEINYKHIVMADFTWRSKASNNSNITWMEYENNTFLIKESPWPRVAHV